MEELRQIAAPSTLVCPDCKGTLWEIGGTRPPRFRCHTGHAYTLLNLQHAQSDRTDEALWNGYRALQEKEMLLDALADHTESRDDVEALREQARSAGRYAQSLRALIESVPPPPPDPTT